MIRFVTFLAALLSLFLVSSPAFSRPGGTEAPHLASDHDALAKALPEATVEAIPGGFALVALPPDSAAGAETDMRFGWRFTRALYVYSPRRERRTMALALTVIVHYEPSDRNLALRTARLCARLLLLHRERIGHEPVFPRAAETADVWLAPQKAPDAMVGAETRGNQVYVYDTHAKRAAIEWVRTVAHEWGHLTLPAARGFTQPENDAAGYLGERLFLKWMREERRTDSPDDGTDLAGLDLYYGRQVLPLIERFRAGGPQSKLLDGTDAGSMDYYIGAALAFDEAFGSQMLGQAVYGIYGVKPRDLLAAMREALSQADAITVRLPAWAPLPKSDYAVAGDTTGEISVADRPPLVVRPGGATRLSIRLPGWKEVKTARGDVQVVTLRRLVPPGEAR
jgi:hypothetical protein